MKKGLKDLFLEEDGIGTVEMILILVGVNCPGNNFQESAYDACW